VGDNPTKEVQMARRERRKFTDEFKAEVVALVRTSGKSIGEIRRDLDLTETAVREWVKRAEVDRGTRDGLTTAAREEIAQLRRQVRVLEEERTILKKAAAGSTDGCNAYTVERGFRRYLHGSDRVSVQGRGVRGA
jgi:transposase